MYPLPNARKFHTCELKGLKFSDVSIEPTSLLVFEALPIRRGISESLFSIRFRLYLELEQILVGDASWRGRASSTYLSDGVQELPVQ